MMERSVDVNSMVQFTATNHVEMVEKPIPTPSDNEVLIKSDCSLVSIGTELSLLSGNYPKGSAWDQLAQFPLYPGYNNIGTIIGVGNAQNKSLIGKKVATWGGHCAFHCSPADKLEFIPVELLQESGIPDEEAVFFTLGQIAMNAVRRSGVSWGDSVAVYGMGILGHLIVQLCHLAGARPIFAVNRTGKRLEYLPDNLRAVIPVNASQRNVQDVVLANNNGRKVDYVFEVSGDGGAIPDQFDVLRTQGKMIIVSSPLSKTEFDFHDLCNRESFTIMGVHNFSHPEFSTPDNPWTLSRDAELFFSYLAEGALDMKPLISHRVKSSSASEVYASLLDDRSNSMGIVFDWS